MVERPVSVVKELVDNALDAAASGVAVTVEGGGRHLVRVEDDGEGMDRDDALLALERHATSKLRSPGDLEAVATLGFRGEALPSIAAVTRLVVRTSTGGETGVEIEVRGGRILAVREAALPRGTTVSAGSLFFNVPARRKFLRAETTRRLGEKSHLETIAGRAHLVRTTQRSANRFLADDTGAHRIEGTTMSWLITSGTVNQNTFVLRTS